MASIRYAASVKGVVIILISGALLTTSLEIASATTTPTAITGPVTAVRPSAATVNGTINPNGLTTTWYFQFGLGTAANFASQTPTKSAGSGTSGVSASYTITGLAPATSYRYRIVASNSAGTVDGQVGVFNTTAAPAVVTGAASHVTVSSALLNAVVNPEASATNWYFDYGTTANFGLKTTTSNLAASPNDTNVSAAISNLAPHTTYYFRIVATSSAGTSIGTDLTFTTGRSVTLNASSSTVVYGQFIEISGTVADGLSGQRVTVSSERFDAAAFTGLASITTTSGGKWSFRIQPPVRTSYEASANGGTSSTVVLSVRPAVFLTKVARGRLVTRVVGAISFGSHVLQLQRLQKNLWVSWKSVRLDSRGRATFTTSLPRGRTSIRMAVGPFVPGINQAAPGYLAGFSRSIVYVH